MEIEELQTQWNRINERLEKSEQVNTRLLKKITTQRISSIWNRFIRFAFISTAIVSLLFIIIIVLRIASEQPITDVSLFFYIQISATIVYGIILTLFLIRHNPAEQTLTRAYKTVLLYQRWFKTETIVACVLLAISLPFYAFYNEIQETWFSLYIVCCGLFAIGIIIYMYWAYMKNFRHIRESLKDLEEFEKE